MPRSEETKHKISEAVRALIPKYTKISWCTICNNIIKGSWEKLCSTPCKSESARRKGIKAKKLSLTPEQELKRQYSLHKHKSKNPLSFDEFHLQKTAPKIKIKRVKKEIISSCINCGQPSRPNLKTCTDECLFKSREWNCGKAKKYPVIDSLGKNCVLGSPYEYKVFEKLTEVGIRWIRPDPIKYTDTKGKTRNYFPDFYLPDYNVYLDPKNSYVEYLQKEKLNIVSDLITLIYGEVAKILEFIATLPKGGTPDRT